MIQTRLVDREKDGSRDVQAGSEISTQSQGRIQREMFSPTPSTLSLKTMSL